MAANESGVSKDETSRPRPEVGKVEFRSYSPGDEAGITEILKASHAKGWENERFWRWKHSRRPNFSADDVTVAVVDGRMAGCFHGAVLPVRLEEGLEVPMCFEGDFAVLPKYRKAGLPLQAHDLADLHLLDAGVILRGGFTSRELNERFYHRQFGYIFASTVTTEFRKIIGLRPLQQKVALLSERLSANERVRRALKNAILLIDLMIDGFPACHLSISEQEIALNPGFNQGAHLKMRLSYSMLLAAKSGPLTLLQRALGDGIRGRLGVSGLLANAALLLRICLRLARP